MNTSLPTNVTAGTPDLPGMLNESHAAVNVLSRDTGEHDITPYLQNGWTAASLTIRRENGMGIISADDLDSSAATSAIVFPFVASAPGVSPTFVGGGTSKRSPVFRTATGGEFYFVLTSNTFRCFFQEGLTATGSYQVDWVIPYTGAWPGFMP